MASYLHYLPSLFTSGVILAVAAVAWYIYDQLGLGRDKNAPPFDRGLIPFVGQWYTYYKDPLGYIEQKRKEHGDIFSVRLGGVETIHVLDNSFLQKFFRCPEEEISMMSSLQWRGTMLALIGEEIPRSGAEVNFMHSLSGVFRKKWFPLIPHMAGDFEQVFLHYLEELHLPDHGEIMSKEWMGAMIWRLTIRAAAGTELQDNKAFIALIRELPELVYEAETTMSPGWPFLYFKCKRFHKRFNALVLPVLKKRRQWQAENPDSWLEEHGLNDLLSVYLDSTLPDSVEKVSERKVLMRFMASASNILFAAVVNTVNALEGTVLSILNDRMILKDLAEEIDTACRKHGGGITSVPNSELPLLVSCLKEHLRIYPAMLSARGIINKPMKLPNGYVAPHNTIVAVCPTIAMRDPERFPDPMKFNPYRLLEPGWVKNERDLVFMPFGHGKHKCLGTTMVQQEVKIAIGNLIRLYELEMIDPMPEIKYETAQSVAMPQKSVRIRFSKRERPLGS